MLDPATAGMIVVVLLGIMLIVGVHIGVALGRGGFIGIFLAIGPDAALAQMGLATANVGLISDMIACPGMDYCALATARSIPIAQQISSRFQELGLEKTIGAMKIKISGCINACGHHHVGHIGILGLDRAGVENYQITLGGDGTETAVIGEKTGPGFAYDEIVPAIERIVQAYLGLRHSPEETFLDAFRRVGIAPFKAALYTDQGEQDAA